MFLSPDLGMKTWKVALLAVGMLLLGMLIAGAAVVFYLRWYKQDTPLVTGDHLQATFNADVAKVV